VIATPVSKYSSAALAIVLAVGLSATSAFADESPPRPTSFGAAPAPAAPTEVVAPDDFEGLLKNCDIVARNTQRELSACKADSVGVDFLAAAYMALWAILMVFFFLVRQRQARLVDEIRSLRERLARLGDDRT
jgi:hypothetical protein